MFSPAGDGGSSGMAYLSGMCSSQVTNANKVQKIQILMQILMQMQMKMKMQIQMQIQIQIQIRTQKMQMQM